MKLLYLTLLVLLPIGVAAQPVTGPADSVYTFTPTEVLHLANRFRALEWKTQYQDSLLGLYRGQVQLLQLRIYNSDSIIALHRSQIRLLEKNDSLYQTVISELHPKRSWLGELFDNRWVMFGAGLIIGVAILKL